MSYKEIQQACKILLESGMGMKVLLLKCVHLAGNDPKAFSDKLL